MSNEVKAETARAGDVIRPRGFFEKWEVAGVYEDGSILNAGWPCRCLPRGEYVVVERCSDADHEVKLRRYAQGGGNDHRTALAIAALQKMGKLPPTPPTPLEAAKARIKELETQLSELLKDVAGDTIPGKVETLIAQKMWFGENLAMAGDFHMMSTENAKLRERLDSVDCVQKTELLQSFAAIGREVGCDHTDDADGRAKLVRCVRETVGTLQKERGELSAFNNFLIQAEAEKEMELLNVKNERDANAARIVTLEANIAGLNASREMLKACIDRERKRRYSLRATINELNAKLRQQGECESAIMLAEERTSEAEAECDDLRNQIIASRDEKAASAKAAGGERAWMVWEPKGSEFDYRVFPSVEDAKDYAAKLDADRELDDAPVPQPVPLFAIETIGLMEAARDEAKKERDALRKELEQTQRSEELSTTENAALREQVETACTALACVKLSLEENSDGTFEISAFAAKTIREALAQSAITLRNKFEVCVEALKFYANQWNYSFLNPWIIDECGAHARQALADIEKKGAGHEEA